MNTAVTPNSPKRTVLDMLRRSAKEYPDTLYVNDRDDEGWCGLTYRQVMEESRRVAAGLLDLGIQPGDRVALLSEGRSRWVVAEFGILFAGATCVPLSIKLLPEEVLFRVSHSGASAVVASRNTFEKVAAVWKRMKGKPRIILLDDDLSAIAEPAERFGIRRDEGLTTLATLVQRGASRWGEMESRLNEIEAGVEPDDVVTISYTSGTTGDPKGIMLTHLNYHANSHDAMEYFNVRRNDRLYIILPLDHSFAHTVGIYAALLRGLSLYFVDARGGPLQTLKNIPINMVQANPHFILTVPALTGKFMQKIRDGVAEKGGFALWLFEKGLACGMRINRDGFRRAPWPVRLVNAPLHRLADLLVFSKVRRIFGSSLNYCVGGGALLDISQQTFFYALGVPVYQGYGLTEATPIISANTPGAHKLGSSGKVLPGIHCRILRDDGSECKTGETGEIVIRGANVMKGYYRNPEATEKTVRNGWLYTGDRGYMDKDDFLVVVGREKALLISADGEKYSPEGIEEAIQNSARLVAQVMVYNDMRRTTTALVTLDNEKVKAFVKKRGITDPEVLLKEIETDLNSFRDTREYRNRFPEKWLPATFQVLPELFTEANRMINSTMKMVRHRILETYEERVEYMYTPEGASFVNPKNLEAVEPHLPF